MSGATITIAVGDTNHSAVANNLNLDGTPATGVAVSFSTDNPGVCDVNASTGQLNPVGLGSAVITATCSRGAFTHTDHGTVTVIAAGEDFTTSLTFS